MKPTTGSKTTGIIQTQLKLQLTKKQEKTLDTWLWNLTGVWNWAIRKIELDAKDGIYYSQFDFQKLIVNHSNKLGIPSHVLRAILDNAYLSWKLCFKGIRRKPKFKGNRNKLKYIIFPDPIRSPIENRIAAPGLGRLKFHKQHIPEGKIKRGYIVKRASGWYLCLCIDAEPMNIPHIDNKEVGIDPGFQNLLTLSTGEKLEHPRELEKAAKRLAQAQRGRNNKLTARIHERVANKRKDRNHKLSRQLVSENKTIVWSKDKHKLIAKTFGKSVVSSAHAQLREMLSYKCRTGGRQYLEVPSRNSTKTCSACGSLTGPTGYAGLSVRLWKCSACGAEHDRDVNAAINTLIVGLGANHENCREAVPEIPKQETLDGGHKMGKLKGVY